MSEKFSKQDCEDKRRLCLSISELVQVMVLQWHVNTTISLCKKEEEMKRLFVDTGAWYALVDKNDPDHKEAVSFIRNNKIPLLTTNFVFDETITLLRSRLGWSVAKEFGQRLKDSRFCDPYRRKMRMKKRHGNFPEIQR